MAASVAPRIGLTQSGNVTTTTSTTQSSSINVVSAGGLSSLGIPYLSLPAVQAALQKLGAVTFSQSLVQTGANTSVTTTTSFGPATIFIGPDQSITFFVAPGTLNINTDTHTHTFFDAITSASFAGPRANGWILGDFHPAFQTALLDHNWSFLDALFAQLRGFGANGAGNALLPGGQLASSALGDLPDGMMQLAERGPDCRMWPSPWFVWARPHGTLGKVDSSGERLGFRYDVAGLAAGAEYRWPGPWLAGASLGYTHVSVAQNTTGDKGRIDSLQIGAYGGYRDQRLHVLVAALFTQNWIASERITALAPTIATAGYTAQSYTIGIEAGRKYPVMGNWVQPFASLIYSHLRSGSFTEGGSTLLEISGDSNTVNALKLSLGVRAWRDFELFGATLTPELRARWVQDILNERRTLTGRFVGDPAQTVFTVNGAKPTPAAAILGVGVTLRGGRSFKAAIGYDAELRANATAHTIHATLKLTW